MDTRAKQARPPSLQPNDDGGRSPRAPAQRPNSTRAAPPPRVDDSVVVRPQGRGWQVSGTGLGNDLVFDRPGDAERLAIGLARRRGTMARIYDSRGRLVHAYAG